MAGFDGYGRGGSSKLEGEKTFIKGLKSLTLRTRLQIPTSAYVIQITEHPDHWESISLSNSKFQLSKISFLCIHKKVYGI
jgi:hypothetical protein